MYILGFNSTHDASAALVRDGEIVCAVEEERFSRTKHHYGFPEQAARACLAEAGIDFADLDHMAFYWDAYKGLFPFGWHVIRHFPKSLAYFDHQPGIWGSFKKLPKLVREQFGFRGDFHFLDHHRNHIASAFWPSGFEEAAALTVDGTGEWETTVLGRVHRDGRIEKLQTVSYPHSVGKLWETMTQYLGFRPNSGEGKVMGLAPYGRPTVIDKVRELIRTKGDGRYRLNLRYFDFHYGRKRKYSDAFVELFGPPRDPEGPMEERFEDIAFALQAVTEDVILELARTLHERTGLDRLVMAGGVSLNSVANGRLVRETPFREIFVQPSAGDAGASLGAALRVWHEVLGNGTKGRFVMKNAFFGPHHDEAEALKALADAGVGYTRSANAPADAAERLARGEILGWYQGRSEYGPRALGNRSILANPCLAERAAEWFETGGHEAPYMLKVFAVLPDKRDRIPSVTHVDGTARVQTVRREQNERYYDVIRAFGELSGVPVILNTSFNVRGEPIVETPADALACFLGTEMDALFLGDLVVTKPKA